MMMIMTVAMMMIMTDFIHQLGIAPMMMMTMRGEIIVLHKCMIFSVAMDADELVYKYILDLLPQY